MFSASAARVRPDNAIELLHAKDPDILFLNGAFHEMLASPRYQGVKDSTPAALRRAVRMGSEREELQSALRFFDDALALRPKDQRRACGAAEFSASSDRTIERSASCDARSRSPAIRR